MFLCIYVLNPFYVVVRYMRIVVYQILNFILIVILWSYWLYVYSRHYVKMTHILSINRPRLFQPVPQAPRGVGFNCAVLSSTYSISMQMFYDALPLLVSLFLPPDPPWAFLCPTDKQHTSVYADFWCLVTVISK